MDQEEAASSEVSSSDECRSHATASVKFPGGDNGQQIAGKATWLSKRLVKRDGMLLSEALEAE